MNKKIIIRCCVLLVAFLISWVGLYYINVYNNFEKQTEARMREQLNCVEWMTDVCSYDEAWRVNKCSCQILCPYWYRDVCDYDDKMNPLKCRCEEI